MSTTIASRQRAAANANSRTRNQVGTCQAVTRGYYLAPSAGDRDGDGDADAVDGWASEPVEARHPGKRPTVEGLPMAWSGGRKGYGHRAISVRLPDGTIGVRSTDAPSAGITSTVPMGWVESHWGMHYLGYSDTITGEVIPDDEDKPKPPRRLTKVTRAQRLTERAMIRAEFLGQTRRAAVLRNALRLLRKSETVR